MATSSPPVITTKNAFPVELTPDDNGTVLVTCPDIPEMVTFSESNADALKQAVSARICRQSPCPDARGHETGLARHHAYDRDKSKGLGDETEHECESGTKACLT